jgi:hypothetical protein
VGIFLKFGPLLRPNPQQQPKPADQILDFFGKKKRSPNQPPLKE